MTTGNDLPGYFKVNEAFQMLRPHLSYDSLEAEQHIFEILAKLYNDSKEEARVFFHIIDPEVEWLSGMPCTYIDGDANSGFYGVITMKGEGRYNLGSLTFKDKNKVSELVMQLSGLWKKMQDATDLEGKKVF